MARRLAGGKPLELTKTRYGVGISWDKVKREVDLDLQAILVNDNGTIIDAVYYNKLEAMDRAIAHSGDEKSGAAEGFDEIIWVNLAKLYAEVRLIIFVLAASASGGQLCDAGDICVHVVEKWHGNTMDSFGVQRSMGRVMAIAIMARAPDGAWSINKQDEVAEDGSHFMDILEPTLGSLIRRRIRNAPKIQRVNFPMRKGAAVEMAQCTALRNVAVSVGWDIGGMAVDLDVSAVFFDKDAKNVGAVYYDNKRQCGVVHTGDNQTGEGEGDDETINVDLLKVPGHILQIFFVVNIYTKDVTFDSLNNAYVRVTDAHGHEMLRYDINDKCRGNTGGSGLIISRFCRSSGASRWNFQAMGVFCPGRKWMDSSCVSAMQTMSNKSTKELVDHLAELDKVSAAKQVKKAEGLEIKVGKVGPGGLGSVKLERQRSCDDSSDKKKSFGRRAPSLMVPTSEMWLRRHTPVDDTEKEAEQKVFVGVGWDVNTSKSGMPADFDVSAVFFHKEGRDLGAVDYENPEDYGLLHSGDNQTGEGDGDDETITVDLARIPVEVSQIFLVVTVYTKGMTFGMVENAYCRVVGEDGNEMCHYDLTDTTAHKSATSLIIAQFYRHHELGWVFKARGSYCSGRTWLDPVCIDKMKQLFQRTLDEMNPGPVAPQPPDATKPTAWRRQTSKSTPLGRRPCSFDTDDARAGEDLYKGVETLSSVSERPERESTHASEPPQRELSVHLRPEIVSL